MGIDGDDREWLERSATIVLEWLDEGNDPATPARDLAPTDRRKLQPRDLRRRFKVIDPDSPHAMRCLIDAYLDDGAWIDGERGIPADDATVYDLLCTMIETFAAPISLVERIHAYMPR
jgi:hypothetical protein